MRWDFSYPDVKKMYVFEWLVNATLTTVFSKEVYLRILKNML